MQTPGTIQLTSGIFWQSALFAALVDAGLIFIILRLITPDRFARLARPLVMVAGVFWGVLGIGIVYSFWDGYYHFFYPGWMHGWGIVLFGPSIGMVLAVLFYWIARRFRSHPIPVFFLAVGAEALLEHLMGIYSFKIMEIPMFRGVNPISMLVFSIPEYILYWSVILLIAYLLLRMSARFHRNPSVNPAPMP
jgi:hypothetical protein